MTVKDLLGDMLHAAARRNISRAQIAEAAGWRTEGPLNRCAAPSDDAYDLPARRVAAITLYLGDHRLIEHLCRQCHGTFTPTKEVAPTPMDKDHFPAIAADYSHVLTVMGEAVADGKVSKAERRQIAEALDAHERQIAAVRRGLEVS